VERRKCLPRCIYDGVATDSEMEERILRHQRERSLRWKVEETPLGFKDVLGKTGANLE
jgi:adenosyl cobinamide kinase/adenosyl cobinamide phosphate guanylyltransferase